MIPAETIAELKVSHAAAWQQKRAAGLNEQQTAQVILSQIEHDKANPPEAEAIKRIHSAREATKAQRQRFREALASHKRIAEEIAAMFPNIAAGTFHLELEDDDTDLTGLKKLLEEHRELVARQAERITELEALLEASVKRLEQERDEVQGNFDALKGVNEMHRIKLEKAEAELKASQAALEGASKKKGK